MFPHQVLEQMTGGVGAAPQAVLGARVLELFQVNFDLPNNKLVLVNPVAKCKSALAANRTGSGAPFYLHETHFLYVLAAMNGAEGLFLVNTGMQGVAVTATTKAFARAGIGARRCAATRPPSSTWPSSPSATPSRPSASAAPTATSSRTRAATSSASTACSASTSSAAAASPSTTPSASSTSPRPRRSRRTGRRCPREGQVSRARAHARKTW
ncbi:hypothetical protein [Nannocystis pusilla]|uniref:hypothetical protein n=1 Tax=Nannocystis pusilla TaxID=889268 RepID=UPI003B7E96BB